MQVTLVTLQVTLLLLRGLSFYCWQVALFDEGSVSSDKRVKYGSGYDVDCRDGETGSGAGKQEVEVDEAGNNVGVLLPS